jgi:hypothetical protein
MSEIVSTFGLVLAFAMSQPIVAGAGCLLGSLLLVGIGVRLIRLTPHAPDPAACWKCGEPATAVLKSTRRPRELRHCARHLGDTIERMRRR